MVSSYVVVLLILIAVFADFLSNEKPVVASYNGTIYFPVIKDYGVGLGIASWNEELRNVNWKDLEYDWALWPLIHYDPTNLDLGNRSLPPRGNANEGFGETHWLGTDELGRDVLAGMIHATRIALQVGLIAMGIATFIGLLLGSLAGYWGDDKFRLSPGGLIVLILGILFGSFYAFYTRSYQLSDSMNESIWSFFWSLILSLAIFTIFLLASIFLAARLNKRSSKRISIPLDMLISRMIEVFDSIPALFLILSIIAISKPSIYLVMGVIGIVSWTGIARFVRVELLRIKALSYMEAADAMGSSDIRKLLRHALPNALTPVFIAVAFGIAAAILLESTLSFLGLGVPAETVTWGSLLSEARRLGQSSWWLALFPGCAIFITVTVFNLIGEGMSEALDPKG